jgi:hypothetical protein
MLKHNLRDCVAFITHHSAFIISFCWSAKRRFSKLTRPAVRHSVGQQKREFPKLASALGPRSVGQQVREFPELAPNKEADVRASFQGAVAGRLGGRRWRRIAAGVIVRVALAGFK